MMIGSDDWDSLERSLTQWPSLQLMMRIGSPGKSFTQTAGCFSSLFRALSFAAVISV
jgi:hypothetical protein